MNKLFCDHEARHFKKKDDAAYFTIEKHPPFVKGSKEEKYLLIGKTSGYKVITTRKAEHDFAIGPTKKDEIDGGDTDEFVGKSEQYIWTTRQRC